MVLNVSNIEKILTEKIKNANSEFELLTLQKTLEQLKSGHISNVSTYSELPQYDLNIGKIYFVEDEDILYFSNNYEGWVPLKNSLVGQLFSSGYDQYGNIGVNCSGLSYYVPTQEITSSTIWCDVGVLTNASAAIKTDGTLWLWGAGSFGMLAQPSNTINFSSPVQEGSSDTNWSKLYKGSTSYYVSAIKKDGTLWGWGIGSSGQIGNNSTLSSRSPVQEISSSSNWTKVSGGYNQVHALKESGEIWGWGCNVCGVLGTNNTINQSSPVQEVSSSTNWCEIGGSSSSNMGVKTDGTLWGWGQNSYGELAQDNVSCHSSPVQEITSSTNWSSLSAGGSGFTLGIKTDGTLWGWGRNTTYYSLADGTGIHRSSPVQEISSSTNWCFIGTSMRTVSAIKTDGTLWAWGVSCSGSIPNGNPSISTYSSPIQEFSSRTNWFKTSSRNTHIAAITLTNL